MGTWELAIWELPEFENEDHVYDPRSSVRADGSGSDRESHARRDDQLCVDTIRTLSMDAVQEANSGIPAP